MGVQGHLHHGPLPGIRVIVHDLLPVPLWPLGVLPCIVPVLLIFAELFVLHSLNFRILFDTEFSFIYLPMLILGSVEEHVNKMFYFMIQLNLIW